MSIFCAQLIAQAMGGQVTPNPDGPEIGWWPVTKTLEAMSIHVIRTAAKA